MTTRRKIRLGVLFPLSGAWRWGGDCLEAVRAALDAARGRVELPEIELLVRDVAGPEQAAAAAASVIDAGATPLLGTVFSAPALAASEVAHERGVPYWEAVAAATELTRRGHRATFRLNTTAHEYGRTAAAFVRGIASPDARFAMAEQEDPFCRSIAQAFAEGLATAPAARVRFPTRGADHAGVIDQLREVGADVALLAALGPNVEGLWHASLARGRPAPLIVCNGAWATPLRIDGEAIDLEGVFVVDTPQAGTLRPEMLLESGRRQLAERRSSSPPQLAPGPADADAVFVASQLLFERVLPVADPADIHAFGAAARAIDIPIGGTLLGYGVRYDERGDNERSFAVVLQWQDGERRTVHPSELATSTPRLP